jgi:hypothetical protein
MTVANSLDDQGFPKRQDDFATQNPFVSPMAVESREHGYVTRSGELLNPWVSMWTKPRETVRQQLETDPEKHVLLLGVLIGVLGQLGNNSIARWPEISHRVAALAGLMVVGALIGILWIYLGGWLTAVAGRMLGGLGRALECRTALAWSTIPGLWMTPLNVPICLYYLSVGPAAIVPVDPNPSLWAQFAILPPWMLGIMAIGMLVGFWQMVILSKAIGEAHQFSSLRGFGTLMLMLLVVFAFFIAIVLLIGMLAAMIVISFR